MLVSVRIEKTKSIKGQCGHDFDKRPAYADSSKKSENVTVFGGTLGEIKNQIKDQIERTFSRHHKHATTKRDAIKALKFPQKKQAAELRKIPSWRKDAVTHKTMIVTFDNDFYLQKDNINRKHLDKCMVEFVYNFCKKNSCELSYIVRHEDETTPHYHVTFSNYNCKKNTTHKFKQSDLSEVQDLAGASFGKMGIYRGIKKIDRLAMAKEADPKKVGESEQDYIRRIKKSANVIHRNVAQMHQDLPKELAQLQLEVENARIAVGKNNTLFENSIEKLKAAEKSVNNNQHLLDKLKKRVEIYKKRVETHEEKEQIASIKLSELQDKVDYSSKNLERINKNRFHTEIDIDRLSTNLEIKKYELQCNQEKSASLKAKIQEQIKKKNKIKKDLAKYAKKPLLNKISEEFLVITKPGIFGTKKKMQLIRPSEFKKLVKKNKAHSIKNKEEEARLEGLNFNIANQNSTLQTQRANFNMEVERAATKKVECLKRKVVQSLIDEVKTVAAEVYRIEKKSNIHQGFNYGSSLTTEQQEQLRMALNNKIGKEYINAVVYATNQEKIEKQIDQEIETPNFNFGR